MEIEKVFRWELKSRGFFRGNNTVIYDDDVCIAVIKNSSLTEPIIINGKTFKIRNVNIRHYPHQYLIYNPDTNKKYGTVFETEYGYRYVVTEDGTKYAIHALWHDNPARTKEEVIRVYDSGGLFSKSGKYVIRTEKDHELLLALLLFDGYLENSKHD